MGPKEGCAGVTGVVVTRLKLLILLCLNWDPAHLHAELDSVQFGLHGRQLEPEGADGCIRRGLRGTSS